MSKKIPDNSPALTTMNAGAEMTPEEKKAAEAAKKAKMKRKARKAWIRFFIKLTVVAVSVYVLFTIVFGFYIVKDTSMQPRVSSGDLALVYRLDCKDAKVNDVVIYSVNGSTYAGRIVAKAGDIVDLSNDGSLYVNNAIVSEINIFSKTYPDGAEITLPYTVPEGTYFILGDNRAEAFDSRICGGVPFESIKGTLMGLLRRRGF